MGRDSFGNYIDEGDLSGSVAEYMQDERTANTPLRGLVPALGVDRSGYAENDPNSGLFDNGIENGVDPIGPNDNWDIQEQWDKAEQNQWDRTNSLGSSGSSSSIFDLNKALSGAAGKEVSSKNTGYGNTGLRSTYGAAKKASAGMQPIRSSDPYGNTYSAFQMPTYKTSALLAPEPFTAPLRDTHKVAAYTQEDFAPAKATILRGFNSMAARQNDPYSPRSKSQMRGGVEGLGVTLRSALQGASASARNRYEQEYGDQYKTDLLNNQTTNQFRQAQNQNTMQVDQTNFQNEVNRLYAMAKNPVNEPTTSMWG